ncbi:hypothetical protein HON22_03730, partial [Candidatus Peregrinibacteria bacterium]|nr:hypothetical protein [Candidatus Peregrinibacteria bacterium]
LNLINNNKDIRNSLEKIATHPKKLAITLDLLNFKIGSSYSEKIKTFLDQNKTESRIILENVKDALEKNPQLTNNLIAEIKPHIQKRFHSLLIADNLLALMNVKDISFLTQLNEPSKISTFSMIGFTARHPAIASQAGSLI